MMKPFMMLAIMALGLAACAPELAPEQKSVQRANWVKTANAAVPACVAAIENRPRDYSTFNAIGYKRFNPAFDRKTDVFDAPELTAFNQRGARFDFTPKEGCSADYAYEQDSISEIVSIWLSALNANGYDVQQIGDGKYSFVANGQRLIMSAYRQTRGGQYSHFSSIITIRKPYERE